MPPAGRILVADDEENLRLALQTMLRRQGYLVRTAADARTALGILDDFDPHFVLTDVRMPGMSGLELCEQVQARGGQTTVILMSAYGSTQEAIDAVKAGAYDYISKPFKRDEVWLTLRKAEERQALQRENQALRHALLQKHGRFGLVGESPAMQSVRDFIVRVAPHPTPVLLQGQTGTGKERVARAIHEQSQRSGPFVAVNCGAIPANLMESELFGHARGAFSGATGDKPGLIETAHDGTLLLDEVGELPKELQVKLLRVLQEGQIQRVGETHHRQVNFRTIAATVRDLEREAHEGRFRDDLLFRLNVLPLDVPPLKEREGDVALLVDHFLHTMAKRLRTNTHTLGPEAMSHMIAYEWPGNVRELQNVIERACIVSEGNVIRPKDLPDRVLRAPTARRSPAGQTGNLSIKQAVKELEKSLMRQALERTGGNRTRAAKLLHISHRALLYKLKDYGIG